MGKVEKGKLLESEKFVKALLCLIGVEISLCYFCELDGIGVVVVSRHSYALFLITSI